MDEQQLWTVFLETGDPDVYMMWRKAIQQQGYDNDWEEPPWIDRQAHW